MIKKMLEIGDVVKYSNDLRSGYEIVIRVTDNLAICKSGRRIYRKGFDFWLSQVDNIGFVFSHNLYSKGFSDAKNNRKIAISKRHIRKCFQNLNKQIKKH